MKKILIVAIALISSVETLAWGGLGHRTVAEIAERNLTPKAKANIEKYTGGTPLASYSTWMDTLKDQPVFKNATRGWHASIVDANCKTSQELRDKHRQGRDAVTGLLELEQMLKNREKVSDSVVMFALKSMIHMVGDMHCPAHLRYTDNRNEGKYTVYRKNKKTTMHAVWDTRVLTHNHHKWSYQQYADKLDTYSKKQIKRVTNGWVEDWLEDAGRDIRPSIDWVSKGDTLTDEFFEKAQPLAHLEVQKAGYRLAKYLNTVFK